MKTWISILCAAVQNQETPFTGVAAWKYENGQKKYERTFKDGKLDGPGTEWYENGQKAEEATFKDGKLVSASVWKPNGEKCPVTNVVNGTGISCEYQDNGQKEEENNWKDGKLHGKWIVWFENGQKNSEAIYRNGELISKKAWDPDGHPE